MVPVYDNSGNLLGYLQPVTGVSRAEVSNGVIIFYSSDGVVVGRMFFDAQTRASLGFTTDPTGMSVGQQFLGQSTSNFIRFDPSSGGPIDPTTPVNPPTVGPPPPVSPPPVVVNPPSNPVQRCSNESYHLEEFGIGYSNFWELWRIGGYLYGCGDGEVDGIPNALKYGQPGFSQIGMKQCVMYAKLYRCCYDSAGIPVKEFVSWVELGRSVSSTKYESCKMPDGSNGVKPVYDSYIDLQTLDVRYFLSGGENETPDLNTVSSNVRVDTKNDPVSGEFITLNEGISYAKYLKGTNVVWNLTGDCRQLLSTNYRSYKGNNLLGLVTSPTGDNLGSFVLTDKDSGSNQTVLIKRKQKPVLYSAKYVKPGSQKPGGRQVLGDKSVGWYFSEPLVDCLSDLWFKTKCSAEGDCIPLPSEPPPPPPTTVEKCIVIDSFDIAQTLDAGNYSIDVNGSSYLIPSPSQNGNNLYVNSIVAAPDKKIAPKTLTFTDENLSTHFGRPCEIGNYTIETEQFELSYYYTQICFEINTSTGDIREKSRNTLTTQKFGGVIIEGSINYNLDPKSVRYDENSDCCGNLQWPLDKKRDGNTQTVYLDYDYSTEISAIITDCGCEEVFIADIYCYYRNFLTGLTERKKLRFKKDVKDKNTWTSPKRRVSDDRCRERNWRVYHPVDSVNDISFSMGKDKTFGIFNGSQSLDCYLTSSITSSTSNDYYYAVTDCPGCDKDPYFAVVYGNVNGSGSSFVLNDARTSKYTNDSIYTQYQLMCIEPSSSNGNPRSLSKFTFVSESVSVESDDIYVINFNRKGLSNRLDPGNFQINLAFLNGDSYANNLHTGSNVSVGGAFVMKLIDNSDDYSQTYYCDSDVLTSYSIVSGTLDQGKYQDASINEYGKVYPSLGVIVLHPKRLNELLGFNTVTGSNVRGDNAFKLYTAISGAASPTSGRTETYKMLGRNIKYTSTYHYSIRIGKQDGNYSNNPTYVSGSYNDIFYKCLLKDPMTYVTSIGLYDSNYDLLAIAKLSKPLKKDFDTDHLVKIRLNW
jgi:hypothetical protein